MRHDINLQFSPGLRYRLRQHIRYTETERHQLGGFDIDTGTRLRTTLRHRHPVEHDELADWQKFSFHSLLHHDDVEIIIDERMPR